MSVPTLHNGQVKLLLLLSPHSLRKSQSSFAMSFLQLGQMSSSIPFCPVWKTCRSVIISSPFAPKSKGRSSGSVETNFAPFEISCPLLELRTQSEGVGLTMSSETSQSKISFVLISLSAYVDCLGTTEILWSLIINCLLMNLGSSIGYTQRTGIGEGWDYCWSCPGLLMLKLDINVDD